jgi:hypothetical protein
VFERCRHERPELIAVERSQAACWLYDGAKGVASAADD